MAELVLTVLGVMAVSMFFYMAKAFGGKDHKPHTH